MSSGTAFSGGCGISTKTPSLLRHLLCLCLHGTDMDTSNIVSEVELQVRAFSGHKYAPTLAECDEFTSSGSTR